MLTVIHCISQNGLQREGRGRGVKKWERVIVNSHGNYLLELPLWNQNKLYVAGSIGKTRAWRKEEGSAVVLSSGRRLWALCLLRERTADLRYDSDQVYEEHAWLLICPLHPVLVFLSSAPAWYCLENMALGPARCLFLPAAGWSEHWPERPSLSSLEAPWVCGHGENLDLPCALLVSWYWPIAWATLRNLNILKKFVSLILQSAFPHPSFFIFSWENIVIKEKEINKPG